MTSPIGLSGMAWTELTYTSLFAPYSRQSPAMFSVPCTFIRPSASPCPAATETIPAQCITRQPSAHSKTGISEALSVTSPKRTKAPSGSSGNRGSPGRASAVTLRPREISSLTTAPPRKPVAPVTMYSVLQRPVIYGKARLWRGPREAPRLRGARQAATARFPPTGRPPRRNAAALCRG